MPNNKELLEALLDAINDIEAGVSTLAGLHSLIEEEQADWDAS